MPKICFRINQKCHDLDKKDQKKIVFSENEKKTMFSQMNTTHTTLFVNRNYLRNCNKPNPNPDSTLTLTTLTTLQR